MMDGTEGGQSDVESAFRFEGNWREYAPIAFTNLLLTLVTLGTYRFWATTRTRRYLWSRTRFIDENLEWAGTGRELFIGFLFAILLFGIPFLILQFGVQALALRGHGGIAGLVSTAAAFSILFLTGVARFRALRYRLSRTYWHGIRGGSDVNGFGYGATWMWKTVVGYLPLWLLVPWSMVSLWNDRWRTMSFGSTPFTSEARSGPIFVRFLWFYLVPFVIALAIGAGTLAFFMAGLSSGDIGKLGASLAIGLILGIIAIVFGTYLLLGLIAVAFYAAYLREAVGGLALGDLRFHFTARTRQFLMLFLVDVLLVVGTLGIGLAFLSYRHWRFFITHLEASGEVRLGALGQSTTRQPTQGEGLLDALDIGAF